MSFVQRFQNIVQDFDETVTNKFLTPVQNYKTINTRNYYIFAAGLTALATAVAAWKLFSKHGPLAAAALAGAGFTALLLSNRPQHRVTKEYIGRIRDICNCFGGISDNLRTIARAKRELLCEALQKEVTGKTLEDLKTSLATRLEKFNEGAEEAGTTLEIRRFNQLTKTNKNLCPLAAAYLEKTSSISRFSDPLVQYEITQLKNAAFELLYGYERPADGKPISDKTYLAIDTDGSVPIIKPWIP